LFRQQSKNTSSTNKANLGWNFPFGRPMRWELFLRWVIIFAVYDASGTEITDPLYTTENFSVLKTIKHV